MVLTPRRLLRPRTADDDGVVAVVVALVVVLVVMPLLALVVDLGLTRAAGGQARSAADAAALAAAASHPDVTGAAAAVAAAHRLGKDDFGIQEGEWAACVDPQPLPAGTRPSPGDCVSFDFAAKRVRVTLPGKRAPSVFSGVLGSGPPTASATSVATWGAFAQQCTLCVVGSYDGGAQQLEVHGGDVAVGGDLTVGSGASLVTDAGGAVTVGGTATVAGRMTTSPVRGSVPVDPMAAQLAALAALPQAGPSATAKLWPDAAACGPGTYQDVTLCTSFAPGVYVLTGIPLPRPLRATITLHAGGSGVVFYVTCAAGSLFSTVHPVPCSASSFDPPRINFSAGAAGLTLGGHPGYAGLAIAFDPSSDPARSNTNQRFTGSGTGPLTVNGSIDGPAVTLRDPSPASAARLVVAGGRLIVGRLVYSPTAPVPAHPYVSIQAPPAALLPDGPVRLVTLTS